MRILVLGGDGFLGWPTALHLSACGHDVAVADNFARRSYDEELGCGSLVPIAPLETRTDCWAALTGRRITTYVGDLTDEAFSYDVLSEFRPAAVVHFAEQRSAPYSMIDRGHAVYTQYNNVVGTLNLLFAIGEIDREIHLVKLGTMGEYGTPNIPIEEGWLTVEHKGRSDRLLYPKRPGSFYHLSKVHDSHNIEFACRSWGLRATDLNQGIVYGQETDETARDPVLSTRFDYDAVFGTVLNRFVVEAVLGQPLTVYGSGRQTRGIINIRDTVECIRLACENPAAPGEFRVFNQMTEARSVAEIAETVATCCARRPQIRHVDNPRVELDDHFYEVTHTGLRDLGLRPHLLTPGVLAGLFAVARQHAERADLSLLEPTVRWRTTSNLVRSPATPTPEAVNGTWGGLRQPRQRAAV